ncbi:MAG: pinensin family lanthipeptide [Bacteroidota bacterium]
MAKKVQLADLKVKSFVVQLNETEQKTAKGGLFDWGRDDMGRSPFRRNGRVGSFTEHKSQRQMAGFSISSRRSR